MRRIIDFSTHYCAQAVAGFDPKVQADSHALTKVIVRSLNSGLLGAMLLRSILLKSERWKEKAFARPVDARSQRK